MTAAVDVLAVGYADDRVASTVVLVRDGDAIIVVDPGMVATRGAILDPLADLGLVPDQVTDVVFSHHHPDHTLNAALFPEARFHDHWAIYQADIWTEREADGFALAADVHLRATPGHSAGGHLDHGADRRRPGGLHPPVVGLGRTRGGSPGQRPGPVGGLSARTAGAPPFAGHPRSRGTVPSGLSRASRQTPPRPRGAARVPPGPSDDDVGPVKMTGPVGFLDLRWTGARNPSGPGCWWPDRHPSW